MNSKTGPTDKSQSRRLNRQVRKVGRLGLIRKGSGLSPLVVLFGLIIAGVFPVVGGSSQTFLATLVVYFIWITLAESWNMIGGYAGLLNLGLVAFFSLGAIVAALALEAGLTMVPAMLFAGVVGSLFALLLIPTFRLKSDYFAIATLVIPVIVRPLVEYFTGKASFDVPLSKVIPTTQFYYLGLAMTAITIFGTFFLMRSRVGIALRSMGDDEVAASSLGVNVLLYKTIALVLSGFIAAVVGAYYLQLIGTVSATVFDDLSFSLFPIFMVIIGGIGTFEGPITGALIFSVVNYYSPTLFANSSADTLVFSIIIMAVAVLLPRGIVSSLRKIGIQLSRAERNIEKDAPRSIKK